MKTTIIKAFVVLTCMTLGIANVAKCQIYSSDICYYLPAGSNSKCDVTVAKFNGSTVFIWWSVCEIEKCFSKGSDYFEHMNWREGDTDVPYCHIKKYEYVSSMSTSKREVYKKETREYVSIVNDSYVKEEYVAFSKDMSSYITWTILNKKETGYETKKTYSKVPKEEFLPKAINHDFLNE